MSGLVMTVGLSDGSGVGEWRHRRRTHVWRNLAGKIIIILSLVRSHRRPTTLKSHTRHPKLSVKKPEMLQNSRKNARKPGIIYDFYSELNNVVNDCGLNRTHMGYFIFNCNESGFGMDPSRIKAIRERGSPLVRVSGGSGRNSTTVLGTISADGNYLPPFIVFKGAAVQPRWISNDAFPGNLY